jgi:hypothetical protein
VRKFLKAVKRLRLWRRSQLAEDERRALERWVRWRFRMTDSDPPAVFRAAVARLIMAGMKRDEALKTALRILAEEQQQRAAG